MVLAAMLFIKRVSDTTQITAVDESTETEGSHHSLIGKEIPDGVMIYRIFGSFFFGAADKLESALKRLKQEPEVLILRMRKVLAMDATGLNALEDLYERLRSRNKHLVLSGPHTQPLFMMGKAGFLDHVPAKYSGCLQYLRKALIKRDNPEKLRQRMPFITLSYIVYRNIAGG
jgi:SulP family sulfate permease